MTTGQLKWIGLILMLIDHIGEFIPQAPMWLRYIGRLSAPLFFYCSAWGFHYTHDRKRYLIRLYKFSVLMGVGNIALSYCMNRGSNMIYLTNNIFTTIFLGCLIIYIWESAGSWRKRKLYFFAFGLQQAVAFFLCVIVELLWLSLNYELHYTLGTIFGSCIFTEGGILFVLYFVCVYFLKEQVIRLSLFTGIFSCAIAYLTVHSTGIGPQLYLFPFSDYQWLMVLVIPFYFLYNGKKGKNIKAFFYLFYPLHIWILYIVGYFCEKVL